MPATLKAPRAAPAVPLQEGVSPVAVADPEEADYQAARAGFLSPQRTRQSSLLLLVTIALFALTARQGEEGWRGVAVLVGVLFIHEMGHWAGMRLFGFQDVQMFFIPFFGAAVSGRNVGAKAWKEALVLLMGPVPGILVGSFLLVRSAFEPSHLVTYVGLVMLFLNAFNLLPMSPLDGGKLFQLLIFSRNRFLEIAFTAFAALSMFGLGLLMQAWVMCIMGVLLLISVPRSWRLLRAVKELRASNPEVDQEPAELDDSSLRALYAGADTLVSKAAKGATRLKVRVKAMHDVHLRVRMHPPSVLASLGLFLLWFMGLVLMIVGGLALGSGRTPTAPQWAEYKAPRSGFSVLMPILTPSHTFAAHGPALDEGTGETFSAHLWAEHDYSVTTWGLESVPTTDAEREQALDQIQSTLVAQVRKGLAPPKRTAPRELAGIAGRQLSFVGESSVSRGVVHEEYWFGVREGRAFVLRAQYDERLAKADEAERFLTSFRAVP